MPQLIFIRHGEKSALDNVNLSHKGKMRARHLPEYLLHPYKDFSPPTIAYIMYLRGHDKSDRCRQTMQPTIQTGQLEYIMVHRSKTESLALQLAKLTGVVVICWEHSRIVDFLNVLVGDELVSSWGLNPESLDDDSECFDATWVCDVEQAHVRLRVFRQFDIVDNLPAYPHDRHRVWFDRHYKLSEDLQGCQNKVFREEEERKKETPSVVCCHCTVM